MKKIGLLSDTHSWIYPGIFEFFKDCDELWHAGDIGNLQTYDELAAFKPIRAVYGNIDGHELRNVCPEIQLFNCEGFRVLIKHIGGYPGRYDRSVTDVLKAERPGIFISGHSHILKIIPDKQKKLLHMNPGSAGRSGLHTKITCIRFSLENSEIKDLEILEKDRKLL